MPRFPEDLGKDIVSDRRKGRRSSLCRVWLRPDFLCTRTLDASSSRDEAHQEHDEEDHKENLRDARSRASETPNPKNAAISATTRNTQA